MSFLMEPGTCGKVKNFNNTNSMILWKCALNNFFMGLHLESLVNEIVAAFAENALFRL